MSEVISFAGNAQCANAHKITAISSTYPFEVGEIAGIAGNFALQKTVHGGRADNAELLAGYMVGAQQAFPHSGRCDRKDTLCLMKQVETEAMLKAIRQILEGELYVSDQMRSHLFKTDVGKQ